ncbi:MAG: peptide-methionine (S)-S-oxide reductase MsrA [Asgard group archaeon]|nr:peptide-methionine (S)-S-oxide reductase MsrA [Asgard group archaeon]
MAGDETSEKITLGGGCFWCLEAIFVDLKGVIKVESGYSGGQLDNPTYEQVCFGSTGHAEVIQITYDSDMISTKDLLDIFFDIHDPTTLNRQGNDVGSQYRSVIFYHSEEQREIANKLIKNLDNSQIWKNPIVTEVFPFSKFFKAEKYHQNYFKLNTSQPYCKIIIAPKVTKFKEKYSTHLMLQ